MKKPSLNTQIKIYIGLVWLGALLAIASDAIGKWSLWAGMALVVIGAVCRYSLIRCPHCGFKLAGGQKVPPRCPACMEELQA